MKLLILISSLFMLEAAFAQTIKAQIRKEVMLKRVDEISESVNGARIDLESNDVAAACKKVKLIFKLYNEHIMDVAGHMDMSKGRTSRLKDTVFQELMLVHQQKAKCDSRKHENVDPEKLEKHLKKLSKSLGKQKRIIEKKDTDRNNSFEFDYRF